MTLVPACENRDVEITLKGPRKTLEGHADEIGAVAFSPDGKLLATEGNKTVFLWNTSTWEVVRRIPQEEGIYSMAFSPDGKFLAVGILIGRVAVWNPTTGERIGTLRIFYPAQSLSFSKDSKLLAVGEISAASVWDITSGNKLLALSSGACYPVAFSPDGKMLATGVFDRSLNVLLWDTSSWQIKTRLQGHRDVPASATFSPDGAVLATGGQDAKAKLWDVASGAERYNLRHGSPVTCVAFTPDGKILATGSETTRLWDPKKGRKIARLEKNAGVVRSLAISPDGKSLAIGGNRKVVEIWDIP